MRSLDSSPETGASYRRVCMRRDGIAMESWASAAGGMGDRGYIRSWRDLAGCGEMKEKVVRYVQDRTWTVDGGYDCTIPAVKHAWFGDAGGDVDHAG